MKTFEVRISISAASEQGAGRKATLCAEVTDLSTAQRACYTLYVAGLNAAAPAPCGTSRAFRFSDANHKTVKSFAGYGYLGGISLDAGAAMKIGGGIKIPNGPLIPTGYADNPQGVSLSVSHSVARWAL